jgi:hypothetical protein
MLAGDVGDPVFPGSFECAAMNLSIDSVVKSVVF